MNAKEYLSQALWLDKIVNSKLEQLETLWAMATRMTARYSQVKVAGGNVSKNPVEKTIAKIADLQENINKDIDRFIDLKFEILEIIKQVRDPIDQIILEMRYINCKSWDEVAENLGYNRSTIFRIHGKILKEVDEILKNETE